MHTWRLYGILYKNRFCKTPGIVHFDKVMFGMVNNKYSNIINWLIINIKYYVYTMKMQKQN